MKAFRIIFVTLAMILTWQLNAAELTSGKVTFISPDGEMSIDLPQTGFPVADYTGYGAAPSLIIKSFEVNATGTINDAKLVAAMYKKGKTPEDHWMQFPLTNEGNGKWSITLNQDLVEAAGQPGEFVMEMYVEATNDNGTVYFNNGGNDYIVMFTLGNPEDENVKWLKDGTAEVVLYTGDDYPQYRYDGDGTRNNETLPGSVDMLGINFFSIYYDLAENVDITSASLQYKIIPEGQEDANWNGIEANELNTLVSSRKNTHKSTFNESRLISKGLEPGNYQLRIMFQLIDGDGKYYFFGRDNDNFVFNFSINEPKDPEILGISMVVTPTPGEQEYPWLEKGVYFDPVDISHDEPLESLSIDEIFIFTQGEFTSIKLAYKFIDAVNGNEMFLRDIPTQLDDFGNWSTAEPTNLLDSKTLPGGMLPSGIYTLQFWAQGDATDGNTYYLNNDGDNYCVTFAYGEAQELNLGDANGDGEVDVKDVTALITHILGVSPEGFVKANANVNGDEVIDVKDVTALINLILK